MPPVLNKSDRVENCAWPLVFNKDTLEATLAQFGQQGDLSQLIFYFEGRSEALLDIKQKDLEAQFDEFIKLVEAMKLSFSIVLPVLPISMPMLSVRQGRQDKLNNTISHNRQKNRMISSQKEELSPIFTKQRPTAPWKKHIDHRNSSELNLDIEHVYTDEMQVQCEVQIEDETQRVHNQEVRVDNSDADQYGPLYNHRSIANFVLLNKEKYHALSGEHPSQLWGRLADPVDVMNNDCSRYSEPRFHTTTTATQHILDHYHQFQFGLDFNHLPKGFRLIERDIRLCP